MFAEVEGIIKRQINVSMTYFSFTCIHPLLSFGPFTFIQFLCNVILYLATLCFRCLFYQVFNLFMQQHIRLTQCLHLILGTVIPPIYMLLKRNAALSSFLCYYSRSYASHCLKIASRFSLPSFNHPSPVPIKRKWWI